MASADDLVGALIDGRYKVLEEMASGSMGAVFKAERVPVGKLVAIKFLHASFAGDSEFQARFERETQVMSKLAHPNCVSVVDFGQWDGTPYLVMEFVAGTTLRSILDDGSIEPVRALGIARQIAAGLAHAHAQGITHRDIKPANIMITEEQGVGEHVRILDFGLARLRGAVGRDATQTNVVVGTPNYMAPEQTIGGGTIDARTDVYAVGVVLFEMIAGDRPFQAEDTLALLGMHRAAPIPKLESRVGDDIAIPPGVQTLIEKAMAKSPDDRYQSAVELVEAIDAVLGGRVESGRQFARRKTDPAAVAPTMLNIARSDDSSRLEKSAPTRRRSSSKLGMIVVLGVLGGGAYAAWYVKNRVVDKPPTAGQVAKLPAGSGSSAAVADIAPGSADVPPTPTPSAGSDDTTTAAGSGSAIAMIEVDAGVAEPVAIDAAVAETGSGSAAPPDEIDMGAEPDPGQAEDLLPESQGHEAEDEAPDAPATEEEVEKRVPAPAPALAKTVGGAIKLIKEGKRDLAIASLRALMKQQKKSAYIPFLLGNLYFDRQWWGFAMDHYKAAIVKSAGYKRNGTLIRNVIRMLASKKTSGRASVFLSKTIGRPALPYLQYAARHEKHPGIKRQATWLARRMR